MRLCVAQIRPVKGDIEANIDRHKRLITLAIANQADVIFFPELSLTGYEPALASALATNQTDSRLDDFQRLSDSNRLTIGLGLPTKSEDGICISTIIFQPHKDRQTYSKAYLHPDEDAYFVSGQRFSGLAVPEARIALAICYELSVPAHLENARRNGAEIYLTSVAKSRDGVQKANERLADIAREEAMTVLMANCLGPCDNFVGAGRSAIWHNNGEIAGHLDDVHEGVLLIDTNTQAIIEKYL